MGDTVQSVVRAIQILEALDQGKDFLTLTEIAQAVDLPKSTTSRLLDTLITHGFITEDYKRYRLGIKMFILGSRAATNNDFHQAVRPIMIKIAEKTNEMVSLNILVNGQRLCIDQIESNHSVRNYVPLGRLIPSFCGASGKVLLAFQDDQEIINILHNTQLEQFTPATVTDINEIIRDLQIIRQQGWAFSKDERVRGGWSVSGPLRDSTGKIIASLSIGAPTSRYSEELVPKYVELITKGCSEASQLMGYIPGKY